MSIAWGTIAVLVLLLPGFLLFVGLDLSQRIEPRSASPLTQLALLVLVSFFVHGFLFAASPKFCGVGSFPCIDLSYLFALLQLNGSEQLSFRALAQNLTQHRWWIFLYVVVTSLVPLFAGLFLPRLWPSFFANLLPHGWINQLAQREDAYTTAYILTNVRHDERVLMYRGFLSQFFFTKEGNISYLVLKEPTRYYLLLDDNKPTTTAREPIGVTTEGEKTFSYLLIDGEDIANVVFDRFEQIPMPSEEELRALMAEEAE